MKGGEAVSGGKAPPFPSLSSAPFCSLCHRFFVVVFFLAVFFLAFSTHFLPFYPTKEPDPKLIKTGSRSGEQVRAPNQLGGL